MIYRKIDENGDYKFGNSNNDFFTTTDAVKQAIQTNLKLLLGEWWEDTQKGFPLFENVLGTRGSQENLNTIQMLMTDTIVNTQGVTGFENYTYNYDSAARKYTAQCTVDTVYGAVQVEVVL